MKKEYDFSKSKKNPYLDKLKKQVTIKLDIAVVDYFKSLSNDIDIPYQNLINYYLKNCVENNIKPNLKWNKAS